MNKNSTAKQFDKVSLEYDFVVSLTEKEDDILLENMPKQRGKVLDIGCGSGNRCILLSKYFEQVVGIDISDSLLQIAEKKRNINGINNVSFINMNADEMHFEEKFDMIISRTTFHHLDIENVLSRCISLINNGGVIYIKDNVSENPTPAKWTYVVGALLEFLPNWRRYGLKNAQRVFSHSVSREWLSHLAEDRYLSESEYYRIYEKYLPGCFFIKEGWAMNVIWKSN